MAADEKKVEEKKVEEPKIEINKDTYTKEEVKTLIAESLKEIEKSKDAVLKEVIEKEKAKLYDTIETEKKKSSEYEKKLRDIEKQEEDKKKLEEDKKKEELSALERLKILETTIEEDRKRFSEIVDLKDKETDAKLRQRDLIIYKERLIAGYNGAIIPEMVSGKTEEELNQAAEQAAERYKQIAERSKQEAMDEAVKSGKFPKPGDVDNSFKKSSGAKDLQDVLTMPKEEYEAYKKSVFENLK